MVKTAGQQSLFSMLANDIVEFYPSVSQVLSVVPDLVTHSWSSGLSQRIAENMAAVRALHSDVLDAASRNALARFSGWGGLGGLFSDERFSGELKELEGLIGSEGVAFARRSVLNAHYSDPNIAGAMWSALQDLGLNQGPVLEPGCGAGVFLGGAPDGIDLVGVELDPVAGGIATALHPNAEVVIGGFETFAAQEGSFAAAIGNVPFGDYAVFDPRYNKHVRLSIHNHFILKALHLVAPGGLVALLTSHYTLDSRNQETRQAISGLADFLGAVRLPSGSHATAANTQVVMDLIVLRRRVAGEDSCGSPFERVGTLSNDERTGYVSEYFLAHPAMVLGEMRIERGCYSNEEVVVDGDLDGLAERVSSALQRIVANARWSGRVFDAHALQSLNTSSSISLRSLLPERSLVVDGTGFAKVERGRMAPYIARPARDGAELRALIELRDSLQLLLEVQAATTDALPFLEAQDDLNRRYDAYVATYGPLNRFERKSSTLIDLDTGEPVVRNIFPKMGGFRTDPLARSVLALERFDPDRGIATKAPIFSQRVVRLPIAASTAASAADALAISLGTKGRVDLGYIAGLLQTDAESAEGQLGNLCYRNPATRDLEDAASYLAGDVVTKLNEATDAVRFDPSFARNVVALEAVQPARVRAADIYVHPGSAWISTDLIVGFCEDVLDINGVTFERLPDGTGVLTVGFNNDWSAANRRTYGLSGTVWTGLRLLGHATNGTPVRVTTKRDDSVVVDVEATLLAQEKQRALLEAFTTWTRSCPKRLEALEDAYNEQFNRLVTRHYDGSHLRPVGLSEHFKPRDFQLDAIWRVLSFDCSHG